MKIMHWNTDVLLDWNPTLRVSEKSLRPEKRRRKSGGSKFLDSGFFGLARSVLYPATKPRYQPFKRR